MQTLFFATPLIVGMTLVAMDFYGAVLTRTSASGFLIIFLNWLGIGFAIWRSSGARERGVPRVVIKDDMQGRVVKFGGI
jgi:hypothetical protein